MEDRARREERLPPLPIPAFEPAARGHFPSSWREAVAAGAAKRSPSREPSQRSEYEMLVRIGSGGTSSVFVGRFTGAIGFSRLFAIKRAHPHLLDDPAVEQMLVTEARLASRIHHANVVAVHDVERRDGEVLLVMEYVEGASLAELLEAGRALGRDLPCSIAIRVGLDACAGIAAVHRLTDDSGRAIGFLHRDVSPQNVLVGIDGTSRITDFGLARLISAGRASGALNGKLAYLAPEVIDDHTFSVQSDVFAMGVVLWEALANQRLFRGFGDSDTARRIGLVEPPPLSHVAPALGECLDATIAKALEKSPARRYGSIRELADAVESVASKHGLIATNAEVSRYAESIVGSKIEGRRRLIAQMPDPREEDSPTDLALYAPAVTRSGWVSSTDLTPVRPRPSVSIAADEVDDEEDTRRHSSSSRPPELGEIFEDRTSRIELDRPRKEEAKPPTAEATPARVIALAAAIDRRNETAKIEAPDADDEMDAAMPPARSRAARWLRVGLVAIVVIEAAIMASRWFTGSADSAASDAASATAPIESAPPIAVTTSAAPAPTPPPVQSAAPSATAAPKLVARTKTLAPKPADDDDPYAPSEPQVDDDDSRPTNVNPLSRAKRRSTAKP